MSTHTPGPWRRSKRNIGNVIEGYSGKHSFDNDDGFRTVALFQECCASEHYDEQHANAEANARLIAAAPDLLEAAIAAEIACDSVSTADERAHARRLIRAAIAKAEGR